MGQPRTYVYRLLKTSWGIWIKITAQASLREAVRGEAVSPPLPVWIIFESSASELSELCKKELGEGISAVAEQISDSVAGQPVTVSVQEVSYQECDFQLEGLSVAMCRWAEEEFGLARREIEESYDRTAGRYLFEWR